MYIRRTRSRYVLYTRLLEHEISTTFAGGRRRESDDPSTDHPYRSGEGEGRVVGFRHHSRNPRRDSLSRCSHASTVVGDCLRQQSAQCTQLTGSRLALLQPWQW